jgi:putative zinc finger/helix-turn-helix YgiT family protein
MIMNHHFCCPFCGHDHTKQIEVPRVVRDVRTRAEYNMLAVEMECDDCHERFVTPAQSDENDVRLADAKGLAIGAPTREAIRRLRNRWAITQEEAGTLFGGGKVAFCKYENGTIVPTQSMARLLALAVAGRIEKADLEQAARGNFTNPEEPVEWFFSSASGSVPLAPLGSGVQLVVSFSEQSYSLTHPTLTTSNVFNDALYDATRQSVRMHVART